MPNTDKNSFYIYLVRHAKAEDHSIAGDFFRPLSSRGLNDANQMAEWFGENNSTPDIVISSPAIRTYTTASIFLKKLNNKPLFEVCQQIYNATADELIYLIDAYIDYNSLVLCGHNPGISEVANRLTGSLNISIPTCGLVAIRLTKNNNKFDTAGELYFIKSP